ncbi:MAG: imidazolonepropionase, partial [Ginsengibacter sp.]
MPTQIFTHIKLLAGTHGPRSFIRGKDLAILPAINDAYLIIEDDTIAEFGSMENFSGKKSDVVPDTIVLPSWCDSHSHLVFAGSREGEFIDKINGLTYAEIAEKGGGILNSANKLNDTSEDILFEQSWKRLNELSRLG